MNVIILFIRAINKNFQELLNSIVIDTLIDQFNTI